ncbi:DUF1120 domain-containing protein [Dyella sp. M7H15-1]|uniref:DUF1120 domain-containing protein n=1 Tax=Dyella sp. M7H15-1 TaxID=2501295 RepID=UPI001005245C|nr:DUF1120 domain-containing protein [Dyella sp. M7H15-1]QAU23650.1 DUF1120 domain-containing protein [Dyella sp. M7H15-1]
MIRRTSRTVFCIACVCTFTANAANYHADFSIKATLVPSACKPTLSDAGVVDYGTIQASRLQRTTPTLLDAKSLQLTVECDAPTYFALKLHDNRAGTGGAATDSFGLGRSAGHDIGSYSVRVSHAFAGNASLMLLRSDDDGIRWQSDAEPLVTDALYAFAAPESVVPHAYQHLSADMWIQAKILPTQELSLSEVIMLDGSATVEVTYL